MISKEKQELMKIFPKTEREHNTKESGSKQNHRGAWQCQRSARRSFFVAGKKTNTQGKNYI